MENKKLYSLDLLRGVAGYVVAITHYLYFVQKNFLPKLGTTAKDSVE